MPDFQLNPSKCPFKILSPMGEGARGGRGVPGAMVLARRALRGAADAPDTFDFMPGGVVLRWAGAVPFIGFRTGSGGCERTQDVNIEFRMTSKYAYPDHVTA